MRIIGAKLKGFKSRRRAPWLLTVAAAAALASCGRRAHDGASPADAGPNAYLPPPSLGDAAPMAGGGVLLSGRGSPGLRVRLETPAREDLFAQVDGAGIWRVQLPPSAAVRLFELAMTDAGGERLVRAEGYLAVTPEGRAAQLRAATGSVVFTPPAYPLAILALDFDRKGGAVVSGRAAPAANVSIRIDGVQRGQGVADVEGRFFVGLSDALTPGRHDFEAVDSDARVGVVASIAQAPTLTAGPFRADRSPSGWRIDWMTPGGGAQTTLMIDHSEPVT